MYAVSVQIGLFWFVTSSCNWKTCNYFNNKVIFWH